MTPFNKSLYLKLLGVYGFTFFLLMLALGIGLKMARPEGMERTVRSNFKIYAQYLVNDIGTPPRVEAAKIVHERTNLEMAIVGPGFKWASSDEFLERILNKKRSILPWKR